MLDSKTCHNILPYFHFKILFYFNKEFHQLAEQDMVVIL